MPGEVGGNIGLQANALFATEVQISPNVGRISKFLLIEGVEASETGSCCAFIAI